LRFDLEGYWSARRGQYRVVYLIYDDRSWSEWCASPPHRRLPL